MEIISCAGYYRTGSSAITDLLSEFSNCGSIGNYEFRFIHDPDGIRDLEYNIIENNNRQNTSNAIKRYIRRAKMLNGGVLRKGYSRYLGNSFKKCTMEYINDITELKSEAWWHFDQQDRGVLFNFIDLVFSNIGHLLIPTSRWSLLKLIHEKAYYSAIDKDSFYRHTKKYVYAVINALNKEGYDYVMIDQFLPPSNINQYLNYFEDNIKVIIVERDPRDIFILENEKYKWGNIPFKDVMDFCKWYEVTRKHRDIEKWDKNKVFFIYFEDLVYKYEDTKRRLADFVGIPLEFHTSQKTKFIPEKSILGTNLKLKYPQYKEEIAIIERELERYLYSFPEK